VKRANVILSYSDQSGAYWGYSEFDNSDTKEQDPIVWFKVEEFDPKAKEIRLQVFRSSRKVADETYQLDIQRENKLFTSTNPNSNKLRLARPN
jgi:hypothetical protein